MFQRIAQAPAALKLLIILALAFGLRVIALDSRSLWYDEAFAVLFSEKGLSNMLYGTLTTENGTAADVHPLLYYTALDGWMRLVGESPTAVRFFSVLIGVATVAAVYGLTRELFDQRVGLSAALVIAIAPFHIQYSQEARMYALLGLFLVLTTWCFLHGWKTKLLGYWVGFGVLAGLSMYTQQLAAFYLIALGLIPFLRRRPDQILRVGIGAGIALLIYFPWLVNLPAQLGKLGTYWVQRPTIASLLLTLWSFVFVEYPVTSSIIVTISLVFLALLLIVLAVTVIPHLGITLGSRVRRSSLIKSGVIAKQTNSLRLVVWLVIAPIGLMWLVSQVRPVYLTRALLPSGIMVFVLLGWLVARWRLTSLLRIGMSGLWVLVIVLGLSVHYTWSLFPRSPFRAALDAMVTARNINGEERSAVSNNAVIVHANKLTMLPMVYYARERQGMVQQTYVRDVPNSETDTLAKLTQEVLNLMADSCVQAASRGAPVVYFVIFQRQIMEEKGNPESLVWLRAHYQQRESWSFNDLNVFRFDSPDADGSTNNISQWYIMSLKAPSRFVLGMMILVVVLTTLPYLVGWITTPTGSQFVGTIINRIDFNSHLAKMGQGYRGAWLYQLLFTAEPHEPALLQTFYVALGHIARITGLSLLLTYHLARMICTALMVWSIWGFIRRQLPDSKDDTLAQWALVLSIFAGGFGLLLYAIVPAQTKEIAPIELWLTDAYTFASAFAFPHFAAGIALLVWGMPSASSETTHPFSESGSVLRMVLAGIGIAIIAPFDLVVLYGLIIAATGWAVIRGRMPVLHALINLTLIGLPGALFLAYDGVILSAPLWRSFSAQNITLSPPPLYYLFGFAPVLLPALGGIFSALRRRDERFYLSIGWVALVALLVYAPLATQRRFVLALQVPLAILAIDWIVRVLVPYLRRRFRRRVRPIIIVYGVAATFSTILVFVTWMVPLGAAARQERYTPDSVVQAWEWIKANTPQQSIFLTHRFEVGNNIVGQTGRRSMLGHWIETADFAQKRDLIDQFYKGTLSDEASAQILYDPQAMSYGGYIWYARSEWNPQDHTREIVFENDLVIIVNIRIDPLGD